MEKTDQTFKPGHKWPEKFKEWAREGYTPISRDDTRKKGYQLILMSLVLILLSLHYLKMLTANVNGLTFNIEEHILVAVVGFICFYLLLLYCIDLYADWKSPFNISYYEIRNQMVEEWNGLMRRTNELIKEIDLKIELRESKRRDLGLEKKGPKPPQEEEHDIDALEERINAEWDELSGRLNRLSIYDEYRKHDGLEELQNELTTLITVKKKEYETHFEALLKVTKRIYRIRRCRFILEVIFPLIIVLFSFCTTFWYFYNGI